MGGAEYHIGTLCGRDVVIARTGSGEILSAAGTAIMLSRWPVSSVICTGGAEIFREDESVPDIVIATELVRYDSGICSPEGPVWSPPHGEDTGFHTCDKKLAEAAGDAAAEVVGKEHVSTGVIASGDPSVQAENLADRLQSFFGAVARDEEGASSAAVCERFGVPFAVIRFDPGKADGQTGMTGDSIRDMAAEIVMGLLEHLADPEPAADGKESPEDIIGSEHGGTLFDTDRVHRIDIRLADGDWAALLASPTDKTKYPADIVIDGESIGNVTFSVKGNSSLYFVAYGEKESSRYSFKLNFGKNEKGRTFHGLKKLNLNNLFCDFTCMKDHISYSLFRRAGINTPQSGFVWLTVNGKDHGLYMAVEDIGSDFLNRAYGGSGVIYSVERTKRPLTAEIVEMVRKNGLSVPSAVSGADLVYSGENLAAYTDIVSNAETKASVRDHRAVIAALRALSLGKNIDAHFDTEEIARFFAVHNFLLNFDSYTGSQLNNLVLYENEGRLSVIPWDYNLAFGTIPSAIGPGVTEDPTALINLGIDTPLIRASEEGRPLWAMIRNNGKYLDLYHGTLRTLLTEYLVSGECEREIDRVHRMLLPWMEKDPTAFCTADEFTGACEHLRLFLALRTESVLKQLDGRLSPDSSLQDAGERVDASSLSLTAMGAFEVGE